MVNYREILRLKSLKYSQREIALMLTLQKSYTKGCLLYTSREENAEATKQAAKDIVNRKHE